ncbi:MAG: hypothetical protein GX786_05305 [Clostridiales bacterium]|nr:hypothetical protein [Clostridiales bacterium]
MNEEKMKNKRGVRYIELVFDLAYLVIAFALGLYLCGQKDKVVGVLPGIAALVLVGGDAFHLIPRIACMITGKEKAFQKSLGIGKLITSITMTLFYLILWHIGLMLFMPEKTKLLTYGIYLLAVIRIFLCLLPQNKWLTANPPVRWGIIRNIPFVLEGSMVIGLFFLYRNRIHGMEFMWMALLLSFLFYLPVVLWAHKIKPLGMLMLPKTVMYLWVLRMLLSLPQAG